MPSENCNSFNDKMKIPARVDILLCTYNGQTFLPSQLDSIASQSVENWRLWVSDDGSNDQTLAILHGYQQKWGSDKLTVLTGPKKGSTANFLSLSCRSEITSDYYAFSDQDDIWQPDKLECALNWLAAIPPEIPALFCSRTIIVDDENRAIGLSPLFTKPPSFANALIQNIGGGNTMVFNHTACKLVREVGADVNAVVHDWWLYMLVAGCGGRVYYDDKPSLRYRQHAANLIGKNSGWRARLVRVFMLLTGGFKDWNDRNIEVLMRIKPLLTDENSKILEQFATARKQPLFPRLAGLRKTGIYRQTLMGNIGLVVGALLNRI
jgi:glycosyltransferase involved in cell wall biosynthesis